MVKTTNPLRGIVIRGTPKTGYSKVLTAEAIAFIARLERKSVQSGFGCSTGGPKSNGASIPGGSPISCPRPSRSAMETGESRRSRAISETAASRSPARPTARR